MNVLNKSKAKEFPDSTVHMMAEAGNEEAKDLRVLRLVTALRNIFKLNEVEEQKSNLLPRNPQTKPKGRSYS